MTDLLLGPAETDRDSAVSLRLLGAPEVIDQARRLRARMHSPLCGLLTSMATLNRPQDGPRVLMHSGELTGVHAMQGRPAPKAGSFHLGGFGVMPFESEIRLLGETLERYAGFSSVQARQFPIVYDTLDGIRGRGGAAVLARASLAPHTPEQLARPGFPFAPLADDSRLGWIQVPSLLADRLVWVPAQRFLIGYKPADGEPWLSTAVTTGTASHTKPHLALRSALEELVQLDSAMGHWYGSRPSIRIRSDRRTAVVDRLAARHFGAGPAPEFHVLPNPDLPGFTVACLLHRPSGLAPEVAVGLGSAASLSRAMYRALLEGAGVQWLGGWLELEAGLKGFSAPTDVYDLEANVRFYGTRRGAVVVRQRFADHTEAAASDLPPDDDRPVRESLRGLTRAFAAADLELLAADITSQDIAELGFTAMRTWSPDTLSLPLPSAPPAAHPRFEAYGGFSRDDPHPYP